MAAWRIPLATLILGATMAAAGWAGANVRMFSYLPANAVTGHTAGALTFEFDQRLMFTKVLRIHSTAGLASAILKPADEHVLGRGGLDALIGPGAHEHDLYEVQPLGEGVDLIRAFCPGSKRAWMAFGRLLLNRDLRVRVLGDSPGGQARLCETLDFNFQGEWRLPPGAGVPESDIPVPKFPY
ncbi:MAG: hypothetical protein ACHP7N_05190 [Caulobacterales bacterium]